MRLIATLLQHGLILSTPTHTVGPCQTATGGPEFAVCDLTGPVLTHGDSWRVAARFVRLVGADAVRTAIRSKLAL